MNCPNCGTEFSGAFCPNCGMPAPQNNNVQQPMGQPGYQSGQYGQQNPYGQPYGQPAYSMPNPNVTKREIGLCILFTIITCGIYGIYWMIKLTDDTNLLVNDHGVSNGENLTSGGMVFLFSLITCGIYGIYWVYKQGERIDRIRVAKGLPQSNLHTTYLVLDLVVSFFTGLGGIVVMAMMQSELNNLNK